MCISKLIHHNLHNLEGLLADMLLGLQLPQHDGETLTFLRICQNK